MSRVHEALRRAGWSWNGKTNRKRPRTAAAPLQGLLEAIEEIPFTPAPDSILIDPGRPHDAHTEEFRSLRTRLNHLQKLQPVHSLVITSPCPGEGKSFTAVNLALAEAQLESNPTLLADFDLRRPVLHSVFQIDRAPGATDYLRGEAPLASVIKKIAGMNLYVMPAGQPVSNPLELLNLEEVRNLILQLPSVFNWVVLDSPPLLFTADANLLATMCDGTILVVRIGSTTVDSVVRAMQSLCENNVLGVVANAARAGELYTKYTYYYSSSYNQPPSSESD
jgi:receptor protein-tyrosine kinase